MALTQTPARFTREIADFLAKGPSPEQLLSFRPSSQVQQRASELLAKQCDRRLTAEEEWELDQFEHAEMLMQLVKATIRAEKGSPA
jgi:hypothetical protein